MSDFNEQSRKAISEFINQEEDQLFLELGVRLKEMVRNPSVSSSLAVHIDTELETLGPVDDLRYFGKRFFFRLNKIAYETICGPEAENIKERQKLVEAFGLGREAVAGATAAILVTQLGIAPAIALVVSAIIVKLFFRSVHGAMCDLWKSKL